MSLDATDKKIITLLQQDASLSLQQLSEQLNLTSTPCWNRIKRLESEGVIQKRVALVAPEKVGLELVAFVQIKTQQHSEVWLRNCVQQVKGFAQVLEFYRMAGEYDYLLKVIVKDMRSYDHFYQQLVNDVDGLTDVNTSFAMQQLKFTTELPIM
ncbi:Lrp/AsnC family transcriptional regulator [Psychromonas sp. 14N.309.X.WAT.B.A12]|jgi:Lrp/AsnC family transcriptional regulator|uniref:Lrp/AsnC family transcriptional regulator n=1 Tax=unclassified Psychromonas TaxID=2614957 RepID=UPI0025B0455B|nr:Lrp/AsnC family transcriptional regulator [Psychromonas sp. 14N.309.X.WAT.B.A12]MDN2662596.1 Lrp/AsnC family transcriptional regulator [Psychromonas sp. 14N.309.X.WAT.B.A12]